VGAVVGVFDSADVRLAGGVGRAVCVAVLLTGACGGGGGGGGGGGVGKS